MSLTLKAVHVHGGIAMLLRRTAAVNLLRGLTKRIKRQITLHG